MRKTRRGFDGARFRQACTEMGLSNERLAGLVGASASYMAHVRIGAIPAEGIRRRIASVLRVPEVELWPIVDGQEVA